MKRIILILLALAVILVGCKSILPLNAIDQAKADPETYLAKAYQNTQTVLSESLKASPIGVMASAADSGSITVSFRGEGAEIKNEMFFQSEENRFADVLTAKDAEGKAHALQLHMKDAEVCVLSTELFGEKALGVNFGTLRKDLKDSVILEMMGMSYEEAMAQIGDALDAMENIKDPEKDPTYAKVKELLDKIKAVTKECALEIEEKSVLSGGNVTPAIQFHYTMTAEQFGKIVKLISEYASAEIPEEVATQIGLGDILEGLKQIDASVALTLAVSPSEGTLYYAEMQVTAKAGEESQTASIAIDLGETIKSSPLWEINVTDPEGGIAKIALSRTNNETNYIRRLTVSEIAGKHESSAYVELDLRKSDKVMIARLFDGENTSEIRGYYEVTEKTTRFQVETIASGGQEEKVQFEIRSDCQATCPTMPTYTNLVTADEQTLQAIMESIPDFAPEVPPVEEMPDYADDI